HVQLVDDRLLERPAAERLVAFPVVTVGWDDPRADRGLAAEPVRFAVPQDVADLARPGVEELARRIEAQAVVRLVRAGDAPRVIRPRTDVVDEDVPEEERAILVGIEIDHVERLGRALVRVEHERDARRTPAVQREVHAAGTGRRAARQTLARARTTALRD